MWADLAEVAAAEAAAAADFPEAGAPAAAFPAVFHPAAAEGHGAALTAALTAHAAIPADRCSSICRPVITADVPPGITEGAAADAVRFSV